MGVHSLNVSDVVADLYARIPQDGEIDRLLGVTVIDDSPPTYWQYNAASSATDDWTGNPLTSTTIKPTLQSGTGRWLKRKNQIQANMTQAVTSDPGYIQNVSMPGSVTVTGYGTGTAYTLTTSSAQIAFGTTSPAVTLATAGTYLIISNVTLDYSGLTTLAVTTCNFKIRRTNNTPADLPNTSQNFNVPIVTLLTQTGGDIDIPAIIYTATAGDILQLFGNRGALSVGTMQITSAYIVAVRIN